MITLMIVLFSVHLLRRQRSKEVDPGATSNVTDCHASCSSTSLATQWCRSSLAFPNKPMKYLALFVLLVVSVSGQDELKRELARIAAMQNSIERLAAYDALAKKLGVAPGSQKKDDKSGRWQLSIDTSPVDDSQTVTGLLLADSPIGSGFMQRHPALILRYKEGAISAYVVFDIFLGSEKIDATVRFGKDSAEIQSWYISTDGKAAFSSGDALVFMERLAGVDSFLIRVTPFSESPVTVMFSPAGVEKVIDAIQLAKGRKKG